MPKIPNAFIYLSALVRPGRLRPDVKVKTIGHIDFPALRKQGFNAVVVDKDNCVTLPEKDELFPPFRDAWKDMLRAFQPGRVLVVSNSAGTRKDPLGVAAELVSINLKAPVLIHETPKPGCAAKILAYFRGELGKPSLSSARLEDEFPSSSYAANIPRFQGSGESETQDGLLAETPGPAIRWQPLLSAEPGSTSKGDILEKPAQAIIKKDPAPIMSAVDSPEDESLRILVIGDRLFTDTLLAHRLSRLIPSSSPTTPSILSIHTTSLPQFNDQRFLRWVEKVLTQNRIRKSPIDWKLFTKTPTDPNLDTLNDRSSVVGKWTGLRTDIAASKLGWDPRKWTLFDFSVGVGRGIRVTAVRIWLAMRATGLYIWRAGQRQWQRRSGNQSEGQTSIESRHNQALPAVKGVEGFPER